MRFKKNPNANPIKKKMGRSSKAKGAAFERRIIALYRKWGWHVQHNTHGIYDMVCTPPSTPPTGDEPYVLGDRTVHMLQPTVVKYPPRWKKQGLKDVHGKWMGRDFLVQRQQKAPFKLIFTRVECLKIKKVITKSE